LEVEAFVAFVAFLVFLVFIVGSGSWGSSCRIGVCRVVACRCVSRRRVDDGAPREAGAASD
jgi:hypothetical protein